MTSTVVEVVVAAADTAVGDLRDAVAVAVAVVADDDVAVVVAAAAAENGSGERGWSEPSPSQDQTGNYHRQYRSRPGLHPDPRYRRPGPTS